MRRGTATRRVRRLLQWSRNIALAAIITAVVAAVGTGVGRCHRARAAPAAMPAAGLLRQAHAQTNVRETTRVTQDFGWQLTTDALEVTDDGGRTWTNVTPARVHAELIRAVFFLDPRHGWLLASARTTPTMTALVVHRTTDGGRSWRSAEMARPSLIATDALGVSAWIDFVSARRGWVEAALPTGTQFSFSNVFLTNDGGITWAPLRSPAAGTIAFATPMDGWMAGGVLDHRLFATHDGGRTWTSARLALPTNVPATGVAYTLAFRGQTLGLRADIAGSPGTAFVFHLTPRNTWRLVQRLRDPAIGNGYPAAMPLAVAGRSALVTTLNRGQRFISVSPARGVGHSAASRLPIDLDSDVSALSFVSPRVGWAVVTHFYGGATSDSVLYGTFDGGARWARVP